MLKSQPHDDGISCDFWEHDKMTEVNLIEVR